MGISVKINGYYFTGLQYDSKRVLPNYILNLRLHVFHVQEFYSSLEDFDNGVKRIYTVFFFLHFAHHLSIFRHQNTTFRKSALLPSSSRIHLTCCTPIIQLFSVTEHHRNTKLGFEKTSWEQNLSAGDNRKMLQNKFKMTTKPKEWGLKHTTN